MSLGISHVLLLILFGNINLARQLKVSRVVAHFLFSFDGMIADLNRLFHKLTKSSFIKCNCIYIQSINTKRPQPGNKRKLAWKPGSVTEIGRAACREKVGKDL